MLRIIRSHCGPGVQLEDELLSMFKESESPIEKGFSNLGTFFWSMDCRNVSQGSELGPEPGSKDFEYTYLHPLAGAHNDVWAKYFCIWKCRF